MAGRAHSAGQAKTCCSPSRGGHSNGSPAATSRNGRATHRAAPSAPAPISSALRFAKRLTTATAPRSRRPRRLKTASRNSECSTPLEAERESDSDHRPVFVILDVVLGLGALRFEVRVERRRNDRGIRRMRLHAQLRRTLIEDAEVEGQAESVSARLASPADAGVWRSLAELDVTGDVSNRIARIGNAVDGDRLSVLRCEIDLVAVAVDAPGQTKTGSERIKVEEGAEVVELELSVVRDAFFVQVARVVAGVRRNTNSE